MMQIWRVTLWDDDYGCDWEYFHVTRLGAERRADVHAEIDLDFKPSKTAAKMWEAGNYVLEEVTVDTE